MDKYKLIHKTAKEMMKDVRKDMLKVAMSSFKNVSDITDLDKLNKINSSFDRIFTKLVGVAALQIVLQRDLEKVNDENPKELQTSIAKAGISTEEFLKNCQRSAAGSYNIINRYFALMTSIKPYENDDSLYSARRKYEYYKIGIVDMGTAMKKLEYQESFKDTVTPERDEQINKIVDIVYTNTIVSKLKDDNINIDKLVEEIYTDKIKVK